MTSTNKTRKLGTAICDYCGKEFQKPQSEIKQEVNFRIDQQVNLCLNT